MIISNKISQRCLYSIWNFRAENWEKEHILFGRFKFGPEIRVEHVTKIEMIRFNSNEDLCKHIS